MRAIELSNINESTRKMIKKFMKVNKMTLNAFAKNAGVHQTQLWVYLNDKERGLTSNTLQKIGKYMSEHE